MALFKTDGVVVRRWDVGEADRLLTLFTRRFGKVKAIAKGCRRPRSRLTGHLEPLNVAEFLLWRREGRELALVSGAELKEHYPVLAGNFQAFTAGEVAAELLDRSLEEDEPQPRLFVLFLQFLRALRHPEHATQTLLAFMVRAAEALGYAVSLKHCVKCRANLTRPGPAWLEYSLGGLLCEVCGPGGRRRGERVPGEVVGALRAAAAKPPRVAPPEAAVAAVRAVDRLLSYHQDRHVLNAGRLLGDVAAT